MALSTIVFIAVLRLTLSGSTRRLVGRVLHSSRSRHPSLERNSVKCCLLIPLKNPGAWKILNFRGIKSPRLHGKNASTGVFRASFFDRTIIFFAAFEKLRVFQRNRLLRRDPIFLDEINVCPTSVCFTQRIQLLSSE